MENTEKDIKTIIYTCDRSVNYLEKTLQSLENYGAKEVTICQGSDTENNLACLDELSLSVDLCKIDWSPYVGKGVRFLAQRNYISALTYHLGNEKYRLILEDDVKAAPEYLRFLKRYIEIVENKEKGVPFILTLYSPYIPLRDYFDVQRINIDGFYGLQACLFSKEICMDFAEFIAERIESEPHDFLIKHFCKSRGINIWAVSHSLFQHIGAVTTGLGHHHQVGNFLGDEKVRKIVFQN